MAGRELNVTLNWKKKLKMNFRSMNLKSILVQQMMESIKNVCSKSAQSIAAFIAIHPMENFFSLIQEIIYLPRAHKNNTTCLR